MKKERKKEREREKEKERERERERERGREREIINDFSIMQYFPSERDSYVADETIFVCLHYTQRKEIDYFLGVVMAGL